MVLNDEGSNIKEEIIIKCKQMQTLSHADKKSVTAVLDKTSKYKILRSRLRCMVWMEKAWFSNGLLMSWKNHYNFTIEEIMVHFDCQYFVYRYFILQSNNMFKLLVFNIYSENPL